MIAAGIVTVLGLLAGVVAAQLRGLRLGGVIVVPLLAVYCLRSFATFVVILTSVIGAYAALSIIKRRHFVYGRKLFVISILVGAVIPVTIVETYALWTGQSLPLSEADFLGSVLPGIAAYNFHRLEIDRRIEDALFSLATLLLLVVVGTGLVVLLYLSPFRETLPPVLLSPESDVARSLGIAVDMSVPGKLGSITVVLMLITLGMILSEMFRKRYALRIGGVIVVPLLALFTLRNGELLGLAIVTGAAAYVGIQLIHYWTLLYGRVLLSMSQIVALLTCIAVVPFMNVATGLLPFFTTVLAGVAAYHLHVTAPAERRATIIVTAAMLCLFLTIARLLITPYETGLLQSPGMIHVAVGIGVFVAAARELYTLETIRPSPTQQEPAVAFVSATERETTGD